jgi:hypothetical protein
VWAVPDISLSGGVALFCGGACFVVLALTTLCFVSMLASFSSGDPAERASAFAISLLALGLSFVSFASASAGLNPMGLLAMFGHGVADFLGGIGFPPAILQLQVSAVSIIIAYLAWRFPGRGA